MEMVPMGAAARADAGSKSSSSDSQLAIESGVVDSQSRGRSPYFQAVITAFQSLPGTFGKMVSQCAKPPGKPLQKRKIAWLCFSVPTAATFFPITLGFTLAKCAQDIIFFPRQHRFRDVYTLTDDAEFRQSNAELTDQTKQTTFLERGLV